MLRFQTVVVLLVCLLLLRWLFIRVLLGATALRALQKYQTTLQTLGEIPHIVHVSFPLINGNKTLLDLGDDTPMVIVRGLREFVRINPSWRVEQSDDAAVDQYLRSKLPRHDYMRMRHVHPVHKADLWRLMKLYYEGGMYTDIDRLHNIPMADLLDERGTTKMLLPIWGSIESGPFDFAQDWLVSAPYNPIYKAAFELSLARRAVCERTHGASAAIPGYGPMGTEGTSGDGCTEYALACTTWFNAATKVILGKDLPREPSMWQRLRVLHALWRLSPYVSTHLDLPPLEVMDFHLGFRVRLFLRLFRSSYLQHISLLPKSDRDAVIEAEDAFKSKSKLYKLAKIGHWSETSVALSIATRSRQHQQVAATKRKKPAVAPRNATKVKGLIRRRNATAAAACRANNHDYSTIPPVFVINVAGPVGAPRRAHIRSTFDAAQLNYVFLPATRCSLTCALWHTYMHPMRGEMDRTKMNQKAISAGNVALSSSHNSMYKRLLETQGAPYMIVAEDDATVKPSFKKWLVAMLQALPHDFDVLRLEYIVKNFTIPGGLVGADVPERPPFAKGSGGPLPQIVADDPRPLRNKDGTGLYVVSRSGAQYLLELNEPPWLVVDHVFHTPHQTKKPKGERRPLKSYYALPRLGWQTMKDLGGGRHGSLGGLHMPGADWLGGRAGVEEKPGRYELTPPAAMSRIKKVKLRARANCSGGPS